MSNAIHVPDNGKRSVFRDDLQCSVSNLSYDFTTRTGYLNMPDGVCTDMSGCIRLFEKIDPDVRTIRTFAGNEEDTAYHRTDGVWEADRRHRAF